MRGKSTVNCLLAFLKELFSDKKFDNVQITEEGEQDEE